MTIEPFGVTDENGVRVTGTVDAYRNRNRPFSDPNSAFYQNARYSDRCVNYRGTRNLCRIRPAGLGAAAQQAFRSALIHCVVSCVVGMLAAAIPWSASAAGVEPTKLSIVWSFPDKELAYPCYDRAFAAIYFSYDASRKVTSIRKKELNGEEHIVAEFPGVRDPRSLSCSQDGQTIAAIGDADINLGERLLLLYRGKEAARYGFGSDRAPFSRLGVYSLLSPDGSAIALPKKPALAAGTDLLRDMRIFSNEPHNVFFIANYAYSHVGKHIIKYEFGDGEWKEASRQLIRPPGFGATDIVRCGDHDVASLVGFDSSSYTVLGETSPSKQDWLGRIGVRTLLRTYGAPMLITASYGYCAFPLLQRPAPPWVVTGLARIDAAGVQLFSLPYAEAPLINPDVYFSKDGCYALIQVGMPAPNEPELTIRSETQLLQVQSQQCLQSKG